MALYYYSIFFIWLPTSFLAIFLANSLIQKRHRIKKTSGGPPPSPPPSPPALPIIGHLHLIGKVLPKSFQALAQSYGPLIQIRMGFSTCVVASNEAVAKEIFKAQDLNFSSRPEFGSSEYFIYRGSRFVTAQYGEYWRFMKKLSMTRLLSVPQLRLFADVVDEEKVRLIESAARCATDGRLFDLSRAFTTLTNNTICRMAMSTRCSGTNKDAEEIAGLVKTCLQLAGRLSVGDILGPFRFLDFSGTGKKLVGALTKYDRIVSRIIKEHQEQALKMEIMKDYEEKFEENDVGEKDVMDILVETYRDDNAQVKLTRTQIKHFIIELLMASIDTSAATLQWTMAELINRPTIFNKLRQEIDSTIGLTRPVKESDIQNLPYLRAVVKESLRLHTAAPLIPRECTKDCKVNGFHVKTGTRVLVNAYAIMRDPDTWVEPDKFEPERFLDIQMDYKGRDCLFMPFGGGRRACPGAGHGLMVTHSTVGALVQCFDWRVKGGMEKVDIKLVTGYSGAMASPLVCYPVSRLDFSKILDE
ncbi:3,9-dihydroxypterocarpan 6A-monooxygenase [Linum grandiflorum]